MNTEEDILLSKWLNGTISREELQVLQQEYDLAELEEILRLQSAYDIETIDSAQLWDQIEEKTSLVPSPVEQQKKPNKLFLIGLFFISFLAGYLAYQFFLKSSDVEIEAPHSETVPHLIADNSNITLSPGSKINYNLDDWSEQRKVNLEGQAYFDVTSGSPFSVYAGPGIIRVLGTQFEVWEKDGSMKVSCVEGKVEVENFSGSKTVLEAGQSVRLTSAKMENIATHSLQNAEFLGSRYSYQRISLLSLASEIERYYDIDVTLDGIDNKKYFSGVLILDDVDKASSYIAETLDIKYERTLRGIIFFQE